MVGLLMWRSSPEEAPSTIVAFREQHPNRPWRHIALKPTRKIKRLADPLSVSPRFLSMKRALRETIEEHDYNDPDLAEDLQKSFDHLCVELLFHYPGAIEQPQGFDEMLEVGRGPSSGFPFLRLDLYQPCPDEIIFGELTSYHGGGTERFYPRQWDDAFGKPLGLTSLQ